MHTDHDADDADAGTPPPGSSQPGRGQRAERNRLLRALPPAEYAALRPHLARTYLKSNAVLAEPDRPARDVYFPERAVAALLKSVAPAPGTARGAVSVEVGSVGCEGMIGLGAYLDGGAPPRQAVVRTAGDARLLPAAALVAAAETRPALGRFLARYAHACLVVLEVEVGCERGHTLAERCARRLLLARDRAGAAEFALTQEALAASLGVRRNGVGAAVAALADAGLVHVRRGRVVVLDRAGLEARACACHREARSAFDAVGPAAA